jgi:hypothetical protein
MPIIRKFAVQGHPVPRTSHFPRGPFPPEVLAQPRVTYDESVHSDSLHEALDDVRMYRCRYCNGVMYAEETASHLCTDTV